MVIIEKVQSTIISLAALGIFFSSPVEAKIESLNSLIRLAQSKDHRAAAALSHEQAVENGISMESSKYLPSLQLEMIDSEGFPGSSSELNMHGLVASPYREGAGVDLILSQTLWDFGRTSNSVEAAKNKLEAQKATTKELSNRIARETTDAYFRCVSAKTSIEYWKQIATHAKVISEEVNKFVKTGQKSVVEKYLSKSQFDEYERKKEDAENAYQYSMKYLQQVTLTVNESLDCPVLKDLNWNAITIDESPKLNLTYQRMEAEKNTSGSLMKRAKADYYPKLLGMGSVGVLEGERLVDKKDYALGIALSFPIFEGGVTQAKVHQAENSRIQKETELLAEADEIGKMNLIFNEKIEKERNRIKLLTVETTEAQTAFELAQSRYMKLEGSLVDLRESLKFVLATRLEYTEARVNFLRHNAEKAIFNGQLEKLDRY